MDSVREVKIKNKKELYEYLKYDFSQIFFTPDNYVQNKLKVVGAIRLRTVHTEALEECPIMSPLETCYHKVPYWDEPYTIYMEDIDGIPFRDREENGIDYEIEGEQGPFPCFGYTLDIPNRSTPYEFQEYIDNHK